MIKKLMSFLVISCLTLEQCFAQVALPVNLPSALAGAGMGKVRPAHLRSLISESGGESFDVLVDQGDAGKEGVLRDAGKLMRYFLTGISLPDSAFWVNLRPDQENEMIDPALEKTDLGRVLLEADLALKKDMARATSPETKEGRNYWNKLYAKAETVFGLKGVECPTLARPWIVPGEIIVRQAAGSVYIYKATLNVRLEQDRLAGTAYGSDDPRMKELNEYSSQLIRENILPALIKRVNSADAYAGLRQVYYSLILAQWFKKHFRGSAAKYAGRIDSGDLAGLASGQAWSKKTYFDAYKKSFGDGEYSINEKLIRPDGTKVRKYVAGGILPMPDGNTAVTEIAGKGAGILPQGVVRLDGSTLAEVPETPSLDGGAAGIDMIARSLNHIGPHLPKLTDTITVEVVAGLSEPTKMITVKNGRGGNAYTLQINASADPVKVIDALLADQVLFPAVTDEDVSVRVRRKAEYEAERDVLLNTRAALVSRDGGTSVTSLDDLKSVINWRKKQRYADQLGDSTLMTGDVLRLLGKIRGRVDSASGRYVAELYDDFIVVAEKSSGTVVRCWRMPGMSRAVFIDGDSSVVAGTEGGRVDIFDIAGGTRENVGTYDYRAVKNIVLAGEGQYIEVTFEDYGKGLVRTYDRRQKQWFGADETGIPSHDGGRMAAAAFTSEVDYVMRMLGITDHARIVETFRRSLDPVQFIDNVAGLIGKDPQAVAQLLMKNGFWAPVAANYRVRKEKTPDPSETAVKQVSVEVSATGYAQTGVSADNAGKAVSDYLRVMREASAKVPFVFRDAMERFVGRFIGVEAGKQASPDLQEIVSALEEFLQDIDLQGTRYILTSGIGANEMYSHQLARAFNAYFKARGVNVQWIVVNNPAHLDRLPSDATNANTIVFEMSRSGGTKETLDFFNATRNRFLTRVVAANSGALYQAASALKDEGGKVLIIDNTPGDIGGRQMNRKTLMVFAPLFVALSAGTKDLQQAKAFLRAYVNALYGANRDLDYSNGSGSKGVNLAEFLFRHRAAGRSKFSVVFDESLWATAKELFQLMNEGGNKNIAGGSNNNILDSYSFGADRERRAKVFEGDPDTQLPIFLVNGSSPDYGKMQAEIDELKGKGIPVIVIDVSLRDDLSQNLQALARASALLQDMVVYFTYITNQDANSNPAVKMVREITAAMFGILKAKKQAGASSINISFADVMKKMSDQQQSDRQKASADITAKGGERRTGVAELSPLTDAIAWVARATGADEQDVTMTFMRTLAAGVVRADVGEAGGSKVANINESFARSAFGNEMGMWTSENGVPALDTQVVLRDEPGFRVSVAAQSDSAIQPGDGPLVQQLADYFFRMYQERKATLQYLALTYMEADARNPAIGQMALALTRQFADLGMSVPLLALPGVAHTGIEAIMSHPESVFNIAVLYTNTYGDGLGTQSIEQGVSVDDATYVYGISNVIRMALGGTPNIIFEVRDNNDLGRVQSAVGEAMKLFRGMIDAQGTADPSRDGGKKGTVLLLNNASLNRMIGEQFSDSGYRVITAESGPEALKVLEKENISLVVTDVAQFLAPLRKQSEVPVILRVSPGQSVSSGLNNVYMLPKHAPAAKMLASADQAMRDGGKKDVGGIAFGHMAMADLAAAGNAAGIERIPQEQLNGVWRQIRLEMVRGGMPCLKMQQYLASVKGDRARLTEAVTSICDALKAEESEGAATSKDMKELLAQLG